MLPDGRELVTLKHMLNKQALFDLVNGLITQEG